MYYTLKTNEVYLLGKNANLDVFQSHPLRRTLILVNTRPHKQCHGEHKSCTQSLVDLCMLGQYRKKQQHTTGLIQ